jgi:hypothetical protein
MGAVGAGLISVAGPVAAHARAAHDVRSATADGAPLARYVSTSGVTHDDIADLSVLRAGRGWQPGDRNSIDAEWQSAVDTVWDQVASEDPDGVFVTGDMVQGFWGVDVDHTGIFGPTRTYRQKVRAVAAAGDAYEGTLRRTYAEHHLTVYPGMGDHEMGGLDHDGFVPASHFQARALAAWTSTWSRNFARPTYYQVSLPGDVALWTIQPFHKNLRGDVVATIGRAQLRWLRTSLAQSTAEWKIVQTEIPPYASKGFAGYHTSGTTLHNAKAFYDVLADGDVDLLLGAEFHEVDALQRRGVPEIIHGGALAGGTMNYLTVDVYDDHLQVTLKRMEQITVGSTETLWTASNRHPTPAEIHVEPGATVSGAMTVTHDGATAASGDLTLR